MIRVTRLNNTELVINADLIELVESIPETMITLTTGRKIMVRDTIDSVISRVAEFKRMSASLHTAQGADTIAGDSHVG